MWLLKVFKINDKSYATAFSQAGTIGLHLVSGIAVGTVFGYFLDDWLGTSPWLTIVFMVFGIIAGYKNVYLDTKRLVSAQKEEEASRKTDAGPEGPAA